jgi:serine/threonine-protein kinase
VRIGQYRVTSLLGAGGMGEVWRAHDSQLGRDVALKIVPDSFVSDPSRLARFSREAHVLASLNHLNIASIYSLEEAGGVRALVLELVEGPTLRERLGRGPLPNEEALSICRQIAAALEAAHARGIVHRDLKPENVKVRADGTVKVLDFGLAKALEMSAPASDLAQAATLTASATEEGMVLGTAAYMAPEQARGRSVDQRTDIWSLGCLLYETLTGRSPFLGDTKADTLVRILEREPDWDALPDTVDARIRALLRRCLQKDANRRLRDSGDARLELEDALGVPGDSGARRSSVRSSRRVRLARWGGAVAAVTILLVLAAIAGWSRVSSRPAPSSRVTRFVLSPPTEGPLRLTDAKPDLAVSPDGVRVAWRSGTPARHGQEIYVRALDGLDAKHLAGTAAGQAPVFSPDGEWVAYEVLSSLFKAPVHGGTPLQICSVESPTRGIAWGPDGTIVFATETSSGGAGLMRVPASGGEPEVLTRLDRAKEENGHWWPSFLPGGKALLFTIRTDAEAGAGDARSPNERSHIAALSLATGEIHHLTTGGTSPRYAPTGHLVFAAGDSLHAARFDTGRLELSSEPVLVLGGVQIKLSGAANFDFSREGTLLYVTADSARASDSLVWVHRPEARADTREAAREVALPVEPGSYAHPRLSPDGRKLVVERVSTKSRDLWVYDFANDSFSLLTSFAQEDRSPLWSPDSRHIVFVSSRQGGAGLFRVAADGRGEPELLSDARPLEPYAWIDDGAMLLVSDGDGIAALSLADGSIERLLRPPSRAQYPSLSPDRRWMAYTADASRAQQSDQVIVVPFPNVSEGRWQLSTQEGDDARWSAAGHELFFMAEGGRMMSVAVETAPVFHHGPPRLLFEGPYLESPGVQYDVARDGKRFLMIKEATLVPEMRVALNWFGELERLLPKR